MAYLILIQDFVYISHDWYCIVWTCNIISYLLNINLQIPNSDFLEKSAFESGHLFLKDIRLFWACVFLCFLPSPHTRMCVFTIGSFSLFGNIVKVQGETLFDSCFVWVSLSLDFFVEFLLFIEDNIRGSGKPLPSPWGVWRDMYLSGWGTTSRSLRCLKVQNIIGPLFYEK